ncbi:uncharacterized protein LOC109947220 [Prunus persica]|nr:uncharacterized protein LOC109947220 [Prunus persica]
MTFLCLSMAGEFSAARFSTVFFNLHCLFDKTSFSKVVPQLENFDIQKSEQSNYSNYVCDDNTSFMKLVQNSFLYNISKNSGSPTSVAFSAVVHLKQAFGSFQVLFELVISLWELHVGFRTNIKLPKQEQFEFKGVEFK